MKLLVVMGLVCLAGAANADQSFLVNGRSATKLEAVKALMNNSNAKVLKTCEVELTDKLTLKCRRHK